MDSDTESFLLLVLSDGNLPTGSFVASSGLEAYTKHGFFSLASQGSSRDSSGDDHSAILDPPTAQLTATINFMRDSVQSYAHTTLPFISSAYVECEELKVTSGSADAVKLSMAKVEELDGLYEATTLNHVAKRASTSQGVALLTLFMKGLTKPAWVNLTAPSDAASLRRIEELVEMFKLEIRRGNTPGHLPICWALLTSALGLSCERSKHLFIFLYARSLLSASIRLNTIGPYAAQQLLLHVVRPMIDAALEEASNLVLRLKDQVDGEADREIDDEEEEGPAVTWPLGEILAARHDLQHSRVFNS